MPILNGLRRMFGTHRVVEIDTTAETAPSPPAPASGPAGPPPLLDADALDSVLDVGSSPEVPARHPALEGLESLTAIQESLSEGRDVQNRTLAALERIPAPLGELARLGNGQDELIRLMGELQSGMERRDENDRETQGRLSDLMEREHALFSLIQGQLDANHEVVGLTASRLEDLASTVRETTQTNQRTASALSAVIEELRRQEKRQDDRAGALQGWIITCVVACIGATAAALALAWSVIQARS